MYNPSEVGKKGSIFGLPYSTSESDLILLPIDLDVTVSYADGTACAPQLILEESSQLDLSLLSIRDPWKMKMKMAMADRIVSQKENSEIREVAKEVINELESGKTASRVALGRVNDFCEKVHERIEKECSKLLDQKKIVGIVGGDHSSPLGLIRSLAKRTSFGVLQIDAHMDLRTAYEGFEYSHASIMQNALKEEGVTSLTQVGIRDFCEEEENYIAKSKKNIHVFFDETLFKGKMGGLSWLKLVDEIIITLPENVYISFDVDGLEPTMCPNTGTPVPGGLSFNEAVYLIEAVVKSGRKIVGFDICETGKDAWDANVSARLLYRLCVFFGISKNLLK